MSTVLVIQWNDKPQPEVYMWPGEDTATKDTAQKMAVARALDRPVGGYAWTFVSRCGTHRMQVDQEGL